MRLGPPWYSYVIVLMSTVAIANIDVNLCTRENYFRQVNYLCYLIQPEITIQRPFKITRVEYNQVKYEITSM